MLIFNEKTMEKVTTNRAFALYDELGGIADIGEDPDYPSDEFACVEKGSQCWIFNGFTCSDGVRGEMVFVYFHEYDRATTVLRFFFKWRSKMTKKHPHEMIKSKADKSKQKPHQGLIY